MTAINVTKIDTRNRLKIDYKQIVRKTMNTNKNKKTFKCIFFWFNFNYTHSS